MQAGKVASQGAVDAGCRLGVQPEQLESISVDALVHSEGHRQQCERIVEHNESWCAHSNRARFGNGNRFFRECCDEVGVVSGHAEDQIITQEVDGIEPADRGQSREPFLVQAMLFRDPPYVIRRHVRELGPGHRHLSLMQRNHDLGCNTKFG